MEPPEGEAAWRDRRLGSVLSKQAEDLSAPGRSLEPHCLVRKPRAAGAWGALEMWLFQIETC